MVVCAVVLGLSCSPGQGADDDDDDDDLIGGIDSGTPPAPGDPDAAAQPNAPDAAAQPNAPDANPSAPGAAPGSACSCDADCDSDDGHDGICVYGVCMTRASGACSAGGSTAECGAGSRCWGMVGEEGYICWPDCDSYTCDGTCDGDGSCAPSAGGNCGYSCGAYCACETGDCGDDLACVSGECVPVSSGEGPGAGPGPDCPGLPTRDCGGGEATCGALTTFAPRTTAHYDDYPINGELAANQYRSYLRRDLAMLLDYATAKTLCKTEGWDTGIGGALGLGDMSESDGAIPGTSVDSPGHPAGTHVNGFDIDLAYYQLGTTNNRLRPVCEHVEGDAEAYHCVAEPHLLDVWRTAFFLGTVFESPRVRVIGVDGRVGPLVSAAIDNLCANGWLSEYACDNIALAYETTDEGYGWFYFHHHHAHISLSPVSAAPVDRRGAMPCMDAGCTVDRLKPRPQGLAR